MTSDPTSRREQPRHSTASSNGGLPGSRIEVTRNAAAFAALLAGDAERAERHLGTRDPDHREFAAFTAYHQLRSTLHFLLTSQELRGLFTPAFLADLEAYQLRQERKQVRLLGELRELTRLAASAGVPVVLLKGAPLAIRYYGGPHRRSFWDLDLLVRQSDRGRAQRLLRLRGYLRQSSVLFGERVSSAFTHGFDFVRDGIEVDLHWRLSDHRSFHFDYDEIWSSASLYDLPGPAENGERGAIRVRVMADEHELAVNLVSTLADLERGRLRLRSLVDLYHMLKTVGEDLEWDGFLARRDREGSRAVCVNVLAMLITLFDCSAAFPRVAGVLEREGGHVRFGSRETVERLLTPSPFAVRQKLWASVLHGSRERYFLWSLASLPFRLRVYRKPRQRGSAASTLVTTRVRG